MYMYVGMYIYLYISETSIQHCNKIVMGENWHHEEVWFFYILNFHKMQLFDYPLLSHFILQN